MMRWLAIGAGALILFAVSHVAISATGGYGTPHSFLTLAVAFGVGLGAVFSGAAWAAQRYTLSIALVAAIVAGEAFGFMATAERLIASREAQQAPLRLATETFNAARQRVSDAARALDDHPTTSQRLEAAMAAKNAADAAAVQKSAERGCVENCRKLLQAQVDAASGEIVAARAGIDRAKQALEADLQAARSALAVIEAPESATPLADRLGVPAWVIDLLHSALGSIAANGLACLLLTFGAHHHAQAHAVADRGNTEEPAIAKEDCAATKTRSAPRQSTKAIGRGNSNKSIKEHAAQFAVEMLRPVDAGATDLVEVHGEYKRWCEAKGVKALPAAQIGGALRALFESAGLPIGMHDGRIVVTGVGLQQSDKAAP
jgi:hypothetical protein